MPDRFRVEPLGPVPRALLEDVGAALKAVFGAPSDLGIGQGRPTYAFNKDRAQYHSAAVLRRLAQIPGRQAGIPILGVAEVDLFIPDVPFVFGEADRDALVAVVSLARLQVAGDGPPIDPKKLKHRLQAEAVHEAGHLLGLSHCADHRCAMFLSHSSADADRKNPGLCTSCREALGLP
jgi:archaemetzincin